MAISPADFYAFSKATGAPVPEDPESRARLAPEVAEWRRSQLKSPETKQADNSGLLKALGIGAAIAGGGALIAGALGRRGGVRMGNAQQAARQAAQQVNVEDLGNVENVYRAAGRPAPSRPAPTPTRTAPPAAPQVSAPPRPTPSPRAGVTVTNLSDIVSTEPRQLPPATPRGANVPKTTVGDIFLNKPQRTTNDFISDYFRSTSTPAGALTDIDDEIAPIADRADELLQERELSRQRDIARRIRGQEAEIRGAGERLLAQIQAENQLSATDITAIQRVKPQSLVDRQNNIEALVPDQTLNALGSAEDQMTGRVKQQLQRNEDLDMSQIDLMEEMAEYNRIQGMEQDEPINSVASQLPDGLPVDQAEGTQVSAQKFLQETITRQRPVREQPTELEYKVYDLIGAAGQTGLKLDRPRAVALLTNPDVELTFDEQKLFESNPELGKLALRGQTYEPGKVQTGSLRTPITGASGREQSKTMAERLQDEGYLSRAVGRGELRGLSRLDQEALESGEEIIPLTYEESLVSTPETRRQAAEAAKKAQSASRTAQLNKVLTANTRGNLLSLRTKQGEVNLPVSQFKRDFRPLAIEAIEEAAGIEPGTLEYPDLISASYGDTEDAMGLVSTVGQRFASKLAERGINLESDDPYAAHTLASIATGGTAGTLGLSEYAKKAGRMEARGVTSRTGRVPSFIPGAPEQAVTSAVAQSTDPYQGRGTYTSRGIVQPAVQPRGGVPALDVLESRSGIPNVASASPRSASSSVSVFYNTDYPNPAQEYLSSKLEEQMQRQQRQQNLSAINARRFGLS